VNTLLLTLRTGVITKGYNEAVTWKHDNSIGLYSSWSNINRSENSNNLVAEYDDDIYTVMVTPSNGDRMRVTDIMR